MITKDSRGITACTLATCCLTLKKQVDPNQFTFFNEKGEELTCSKTEFKEMVDAMYCEGILENIIDT